MPRLKVLLAASVAVAASLPLDVSPAAAQSAPGRFAELTWRNIGPFRAGRTKAATGVPQQPNLFYIAAVNGGAWKTTDYGRTWTEPGYSMRSSPAGLKPRNGLSILTR